MQVELQTILTLLVLCVVAAFGCYKVYGIVKKNGIGQGAIEAITFIFKNLDDFVDSLQEAMADMGGIKRDEYESDVSYRRVLIEKAVTIIEKSAAENGIKFTLTHDTLVNLAEIVITQAIKATEQQKMLEEVVEMPKEIPENDKVDITEHITSE